MMFQVRSKWAQNYHTCTPLGDISFCHKQSPHPPHTPVTWQACIVSCCVTTDRCATPVTSQLSTNLPLVDLNNAFDRVYQTPNS